VNTNEFVPKIIEFAASMASFHQFVDQVC